ncbi:MAG: hypothetical protein ACK5EA_27465, partial [Planctomycetaceae bacterium]
MQQPAPNRIAAPGLIPLGASTLPGRRLLAFLAEKSPTTKTPVIPAGITGVFVVGDFSARNASRRRPGN